MSAAFSAIIMTGALMLPPTRSGITGASTTRSRSTPKTGRPEAPTAIASGKARAQRPQEGRHTSATLSDQVLALATGRTQHEIASACKGARPNHVGAAISRHKRAGRIEERDGKLYASQATDAAQHAAV